MNLPKTRKEQEIWQACDDLLASGKTVREITGEAIAVRLRELRYKAGSSNERYKYRDSWMAARGLSREEQGRGVADISDPIARAAAVFREGLERELKLEYQKKYEQLEAQLAERNQALQEKEAQIQALQEQLNSLTQEQVQLQSRYQVQSQTAQALHEESIGQRTLIIQLQQQIEREEQRYQAHLTELHQHITTQTQDNESKQQKLEQVYQAHLSSIKELSENQRHRFIVELDELKMVLKRQQQAQQKEQEAYLELCTQHQALQMQYQHLKTETHNTQAQSQIQAAQDKQVLQHLLSGQQQIQALLSTLPSFLLEALEEAQVEPKESVAIHE